VLRSVDVSLAAGESLAVVGRTGSGKTTLLRLLLGYLEPDEGTVLVGDRPPASVPPWQRWSHIGAVAQRPRLLRASLRDNLTMFDAACPDRAVLRMLDRFGLSAWLAGRENGLDTMIEVPEDVSAGEAQLIGIIRAVLREPGVLLLDEISARLDSQTELLLVGAMSALLRGRTTVVVTHHLALFAASDRAVLLRDGSVHGSADLRGLDPGAVNALWQDWRSELGVPS
jgi:ABC-type multidrug transport system fused ATPase/permease subunit